MALCRPDRLQDHQLHAVEMLAPGYQDWPCGSPHLAVEGLDLAGPRMDRRYWPVAMTDPDCERDAVEAQEDAL